MVGKLVEELNREIHRELERQMTVFERGSWMVGGVKILNEFGSWSLYSESRSC